MGSQRRRKSIFLAKAVFSNIERPNNSFKPTQLRGGNVLRLVRSYLPPLRRSA